MYRIYYMRGRIVPTESITFVVKGKLSTICSCCFQSRLNCTGSHKLFTAQTCHDLLGDIHSQV